MVGVPGGRAAARNSPEQMLHTRCRGSLGGGEASQPCIFHLVQGQDNHYLVRRIAPPLTKMTKTHCSTLDAEMLTALDADSAMFPGPLL